MATAITVLYSAPPFRTKRLGIWANVTIAIPRGVLLKVAGWSAVKTVVAVEPWFIGGIFGLFLLGASTTKDFADMEGDARGGCRTLPIIYGVRRAAWMISPSFVLPFLMIAVGAFTGILTGNFALLLVLSAGMTAYGLYVCYLMLRRPEDLAVEENHVSWAHMYRMMFVAQIGFAARLPLLTVSVSQNPPRSPVDIPQTRRRIMANIIAKFCHGTARDSSTLRRAADDAHASR